MRIYDIYMHSMFVYYLPRLAKGLLAENAFILLAFHFYCDSSTRYEVLGA